MMPIIPTAMDVLCGKDKACLQAKGSRHFRDVIDSYVPRYLLCKSKFEKMTITKEIYEVVSRESRFLKYNEADQVWGEITAMAARDKIGHSLRFSSRAKRRHQKKKTHKRSGSASSNSSSESSESNPLTSNALVDLLQKGAATTKPSTPPPLTEVSSVTSFSDSSSSSSSSNPLDDFLNLELKFDITNSTSEGDIYNSMDDLKLLIEEGNIVSTTDPLESFMDDIMNVVKDIEAHEIKPEEESLLSLLSEPVGDWDEDTSILLC